MLAQFLFCLFISKITIAQINGEFWWLSDKVAKLTGDKPTPPKFEQLSEFDTDDSAKIIFRDGPVFSTEDKNENDKSDINSLDFNKIVWPDDKTLVQKPTLSNVNKKPIRFAYEFGLNPEITSTQKVSRKLSEDVFVFKFPEDDNFIEYPLKTELDLSPSQNTVSNSISKPRSKDDSKEEPTTEHFAKEKNDNREDLFSFQFPKDENFSWAHATTEPTKAISNQTVVDLYNESVYKDGTSLIATKANTNSENICSFIKKNECYRQKGIVYSPEKFHDKKITNEQSNLVCCVLPLPQISKIYFPDSSEMQARRFRRSSNPESANPTLTQREFLLRQKFRPQNVKPIAGQTRVVTPSYDDYGDPYWNIKSSNFKKQGTQSSQKHNYDDPDYVEDYVVELPRPGLVGLYSDNTPSWSYDSPKPSYGGSVDYSEEDDGTTFEYSTVDPRRSTSKNRKRGRPVKLTTSFPEDDSYDPESQTVSFQSTPNFQVLQGFKLLNLGRNKNKFYSKTTRRSTTEGSIENDSKETTKVDSDVDDGIQQVFNNCGRTAVNQIDADGNDKQFGEAAIGSHPWLALVVLTRQPQGILCYATIVHPRAAVTSGDCVYGRTAAKEVTLVAGLWNINDRTRAQNRFVTATLHPQYRPKILAHNLALLHWKTPLRLNADVQPACLGSPHSGDDCKFIGWGGFDQDVRTKPRWQRASILPEQECAARLSKSLDLPDDGFCATVQTRGTVTGIGGPLICDVNGRKTTTGVSVWRDNALVLIPAHEWIIRAFEDLGIEQLGTIKSVFLCLSNILNNLDIPF